MTRQGLVAATAAALLAGALVAGTSPADAHQAPKPHAQRLAPRTHFTMKPDGSSGLTQGGEGIPNIDSVKSTIRTYYNATNGIADKTSSPYISEMKAIEARELRSLPRIYAQAKRHHQRPAIVFDADDTTLWTYDMEDGAMKFNYDPTLQNEWVQDARFPATPGMVSLVNKAAKMGFAIFGITGRTADQEPATLTNLADVGYTPFDADNFYTKWNSGDAPPAYVSCVSTCTTVEYKAYTRKHIERLGYDIVLNVGDQWSDLQGGYADRTLKLPNPTYYLPSADLPGLKEPWLAPRTHFTMKPDGSSGLTESGEGIPNSDSVKSTIRTYEGATSAGISDKDDSPYIDEMASVVRHWKPRLVSECSRLSARGAKPAIVFDADDTTLWTYDMEDGAMKFNYDPALQDVWVQNEQFPATPSMVGLVNAVGDAGCTIVGLTGRNDAQKDATLGNLAKVGYEGFTPENYYTKWVSGATPPAYVDCGSDNSCSTIEYKSQTRKHVAAEGYRIVANLGDQYSDLIGGYAEHPIKLPNPTYYLP
ncbi:HAD family acid phosphatase [Nocardioides cheoyonin]|uniref:HAD family acid phosphatase n=1 Tax=Nocardioides cheoyonin TaxID=3156615 RepID=UPI0032B3890D